MKFKNIIYNVFLILGVLILLGIAIIRPDYMFVYSILGIVILMGSGIMIMREKENKNDR